MFLFSNWRRIRRHSFYKQPYCFIPFLCSHGDRLLHPFAARCKFSQSNKLYWYVPSENPENLCYCILLLRPTAATCLQYTVCCVTLLLQCYDACVMFKVELHSTANMLVCTNSLTCNMYQLVFEKTCTVQRSKSILYMSRITIVYRNLLQPQ